MIATCVLFNFKRIDEAATSIQVEKRPALCARSLASESCENGRILFVA